MPFSGLTFDTHTVMSNSFEFDTGLLAQLKQFKGGPVRIVVSDVIVREIEKHLVEKTKKIRDAIELAHRDGVRFGLVTGKNGPVAGIDAEKIAKDRLQTFLNEIGAEIVPTDAVSLEGVLQRYFRSAPPFSIEKGKKKEFPDAIALLALEAWAENLDTEILAVSGDSDWAKFATASAHVRHEADLSAAIQAFQKNFSAALELGKMLCESIGANKNGRVAKYFFDALSDAVSTQAFRAEADTEFDLKQQNMDVSLKSFDFPSDFAIRMKALALHGDYLAIEVPVEIKVSADVNFEVFASSVSVSEAFVSREVEIEALILVAFEGKLRTAGISSVTVDVVECQSTIDLGNVDEELGFGDL